MLLTPVTWRAPSGLSLVAVGTASGGAAATWTFASVNIGEARSDRVLVVLAGGGDGSGSFNHVDAVSVGGVAMTRQVEEVQAFEGASIWIKSFASGTAANFDIGQSGSWMTGAAIQVYAVYGPLVTQTATQTTAGNFVSSDKLTDSLTIPAKGFGVSCAYSSQQTGYKTWGWVNMTANITQNVSTGGTYYENFGTSFSTVPGALTREASLSGLSSGNAVLVQAAFH
jgi:hypothetical protein